jgi:hypothetical protein
MAKRLSIGRSDRPEALSNDVEWRYLNFTGTGPSLQQKIRSFLQIVNCAYVSNRSALRKYLNGSMVPRSKTTY